ncbi:hypothetical protein H2203_005484, partial [Taxawa tesnikishii (nom. ined.)]
MQQDGVVGNGEYMACCGGDPKWLGIMAKAFPELTDSMKNENDFGNDHPISVPRCKNDREWTFALNMLLSPPNSDIVAETSLRPFTYRLYTLA